MADATQVIDSSLNRLAPGRLDGPQIARNDDAVFVASVGRS
jgi:hypothetical protein